MGLKDIYRKLVGAGKKSAKKQQKKKVKAQPKPQKSSGKSTGTSNHRGGSNAPSNKTQNRNTQRSSGSSGTTQRPAARAGAVGAASKGSVTPKTGAVKPTQKKKNNVSSRSGAIGAASKGSVTKVTNTSSSRGDKIANGIGYGLGYIGKEHAAKAAKALGSAAKAPQIAAERAGTGHKAGSYAPTKNERRNAAQDRVAQRRKDENAKKKAQEEAVKSGDYKNYYSATFERDSKGNIVRDKDGNAKIVTNKRGATGKNVQMSQTATKAVNKGVKKLKESAESDLEKGAASFSGKKKDYEIPIYSDYKRNQARQEAKRTYTQAKQEFEETKKKQVKSAVKDFDKLVKEQGWSEDTVLNNGMTVAEYRKQYGKDVKEELDNSPEAKKQLEDYRKQLEEGAENAGKISLSSQDIYKGGTKLANELVDYLVPYAGTAKLSVKAADAAMKASKLGKAGKILTETTETGGKVLTKSGKDFVRKALADGIKEGKSTEVILKETRKKIMRNDRLTTAGKELLANAIQDASIGTTIDLAKGMEQGLEGKDLENWMKTSAVMNLAMGAPIAGIAGRTGKAGKRQLTNSLKETTNKEFATINKMTRLEGSELLRLQAKQGTTGLSEKESKRLDELTTKALDNRGGIAQIDKNGKLVTNNNGVIKDAISPQEIKDFTRLQAKQANGTLTKSDMDSFVKLSNKVEEAYAAVKDNADSVLRLGGKNVDRRSMESAVNFYKTIGDKKSLAKAQKILDKDIKNAIARNEELSSALESLANKTGVGYRFVDNNEMAAAVGEKASQDSFFIKGAYTVDKDGNPQILINRDAPQAHQTIIGHETGHIVKDANPEEFKELGEMLRSYATDKGEFEAFEKEMRTNYPELAKNKEAFDEEITCELLGRYIFGDDDKFIKRLADERPSAFEKIIDYIKNLAAKIKNPELVKQLDDISKKADDIIGNIDKNKVRANAGEVRESKGYHAGDLGKSESHGNQTSERNTGAYGTGTYFVGDEKIIGKGTGYGDRPHETVDFDNYNLYRPTNEEQGKRVHSNLLQLNRNSHDTQRLIDKMDITDEEIGRMVNLVNEATYSQKSLKDLNGVANKVLSKGDISNLRRRVDEIASRRGQVSDAEYRAQAELIAKDTQKELEDLGLELPEGHYEDHVSRLTKELKEKDMKSDDEIYFGVLSEQLDKKLKSMDDFNSEFVEEVSSARNIVPQLAKDLNRTEQEVRTAIDNAYETVNKYTGDLYTKDSASTLVMKELGFEGVDVRGIKGLDTTEYGSVIYDLKGKDLARKQEIGTARFSKTKRDIQRDKIQDIFRQPIPKEDREFVSESFDSIVNSIKNGKSKDAEMEARALAEEFGAVEEITPRPEARAELRGVKDYLKGTTLHMPQSEGMARAGAFKDFKESLGPYNSRVLKIRKNTTGKNPSIGIDEAWRRIDDEYHETLLDAERRVLGDVSHEDIDEVQKFQVLADLSSRRLEDTDSRVPIPEEHQAEEYDAMARDIMEEANKIANPEPAKPKETTPEEAKPEPSSTEAQKENPTMTVEEEAALKDRLGLGEEAPTKPEEAPTKKSETPTKDNFYESKTGIKRPKSLDEFKSIEDRWFKSEINVIELEKEFNKFTDGMSSKELKEIHDYYEDQKAVDNSYWYTDDEGTEILRHGTNAPRLLKIEELFRYKLYNAKKIEKANAKKTKQSAKEAELYKKAKVSQKEVTSLTDKELKDESRSLYFGIKNGKTKEHIELRKQRQKAIDAEIERRKAETPAYAKLTDEQMGPDDPGWSIKDRDDTAPTEPETNLKVKSINKTSESVMPKSTWRTSMRRLLENSLVGFENYAKKNGNKKMLGLINNVQHSSNKFASWIEGVRSGMDRKESGKGLNAIFDDAQLFGKKNIERRTDFVNYLTYQHAIDRLKYGKPVHADPATGLSKYTADEYRQMMEDIAAKYRTGDEGIPKVIADFEKDIRGYYSDIMKMRVDSGLVSKEFAEELEEKYPHYIPTLRENDDWLLNGIESGGKQQFGISDPIKVAKGGSEELMDLYQSTLLITKDVIRDAEQNALIREYANSLGADISKISEKGQAEFPSFAAHATKTDGGWRVSFFQDGQMVTMPVDKQIALGLREINGKEYERLLNITSKIAPAMRAFKAPITDYNIIFGVRNGARDIQQAAVNSKDLKYFTTNIPTAQASILKMNIPGGTKDPWMRSYEATGGMYSTFFTQDRKILEPGSKTGIKKGVDATAGRALRGLENINSAIEITPRMAEYIGTIKKAVDTQLRKEGSSLAKMRTDLAKEMYPGKIINDLTSKQYDKLQDEFAKRILDMADTETIEAAARNAADITLNFSRNGVIGKALNMGFVPYFNPSIQGLSKTMRMFTENKAEGMKALLNFGMKIGVMTMAPAAINEIALKDNRDYQNLATREKDTNFFIPIGDGKFIKIPKPRENAVLAEPVTYGLRYFFDKARIGAIEPGEYSQWKDLGQLFISAKENIGPVPLNENLFAPIVRLAQNKTWYGGSIESAGEVLQKKEGNLKNSDIYDEGTSALAIQIGRQKIGGKTISDISHLSPKKIDDLMDSYLGVIYDLGISQTADRTNGNPVVNQFIKDSIFSNKNGTELWAEFDKANAPKTTGGKVKKWAKDQVLGHSALNINEKSQEAQDWLNQKGYDDITWSTALKTIYNDKDYTPAQQKKIEREWKIKQNEMRRNLVYGDKEVKPGSDPVKLISEKVGVNKAMKDYTYTYVDPETGEKKNQHLDAWNAYKKSDEYKGDKKGSGEKFINFYARMRWTNGRIGESKSYPSWMTASVLAATGKGNNDELAKAYIRPDGDKDGSFQQSIVQRGKNYKEAGGTQAYFRKSQKSLFESGRKLNYDYTNKMNPWDSAMTLANDKQKFIDIAYYSSDVSGKVSRRMNYARCLDKKGYTTKQIYDFAKKYDIKLPKTQDLDKEGSANAWKTFNAKVEAAVKKEYGDKPLEEQAAVYHVITDDSYNRPFGDVGDYGLKGDTGITDLDARNYGGWGRGRRRGRRRRGRGGYGGGGGGGSGSGATMPETASGAIKGKVTNPFGKVADYRIKSNLDDVYRNRTKKLREATRKKLS